MDTTQLKGMNILCFVVIFVTSSAEKLNLLPVYCPLACQCVRWSNGTNVNCADSQLLQVPSDLPPNIISLDMSQNDINDVTHMTSHIEDETETVTSLSLHGNNIKRVPSHAFRTFSNLVDLDLSLNRIERIASQAFASLYSLRTLNLSRNHLSHLKPEVLRNNQLLTSLDLSDNQVASLSDLNLRNIPLTSLDVSHNFIQHLQRDQLFPVMTSLKYFKLSNSQRPLSIDIDTFVGFNLQSIDLKNNQIIDFAFLNTLKTVNLTLDGNTVSMTSLQGIIMLQYVEHLSLSNCSIRDVTRADLASLQQVRSLDLSRNNLRSLPEDVFSQCCSQLQFLNIAHNRLRSISPHLFRNLHSLTNLDVSFNQIQTFDTSLQNVFDVVTTLALRGNPLHCNCELVWLRRWLDERDVSTNEGLDCHSPHWRRFIETKEVDLLCSPPQITYISPNSSVTAGEEVMLSCQARGDPAPVVQFEGPVTSTEYTVLPSQNKSSLVTFAAVAFGSEDSLYECRASNVAGNASSFVYVTVVANTTSQTTTSSDDDVTTVAAATPAPPENLHLNTTTSQIADVTSRSNDVTQSRDDSSLESAEATTSDEFPAEVTSKNSKFYKLIIAVCAALFIALVFVIVYVILRRAVKRSARKRYAVYREQRAKERQKRHERAQGRSYKSRMSLLENKPEVETNGVAHV